MKKSLLLGLLILSSNVFASTFGDIQSLSNKKLEAARAEMANLEVVTHSDFKKVVVLKAKGKTLQQQREATIAQAAHTLCRFFDDGVAIGLNTKDEAGNMAAVLDFTEPMQMSDDDIDYINFVSVVKKLNAEPGVELYSGSASGNNTYGQIIGVYDTKTNELAVFANTNCGSDN